MLRGNLFNVVHEAEQSVPANAAEAGMIGTVRPPDEYGLAHDVVFRHESPVA